jgi:peptide/nickel transport system substrate-binding protein
MPMHTLTIAPAGKVPTANHRRRVYRLALMALSACFMFSGCLRQSQEQDQSSEKAVVRSKGEPTNPLPAAPLEIDPAILGDRSFGEAPMLENKVLSGEIPPVSERLPENPLVLRPLNEIGRYGDSIRRALASDINDQSAISKTLSESLMGFERPMPDSILHNLAESHEFTDEGRTIILKLRKGVKWSDGTPFTVDDILFWYEDMTLDDEARYASHFPSRWMRNGQPLKMEKVGDFQLKISSTQPLGGILKVLTHDDIAIPKHVFARHHPRYNPDANYEDFRQRTTDGQLAFEPGIPRLSAWVPVQWEHGRKAVYRRNPYYWKIDTAGNQLPYADELVFTVIPNPELTLLKFMAGEIDLHDLSNYTKSLDFLRQEESNGVYELHFSTPTPSLVLYLNWDAPRPVVREAFRKRKVRIALSQALNREEISHVIFGGLLEPSGFSYSRSSPTYSREASMLYSQYDPSKAAELLDQEGYVDSDRDGFREFTDGSRFELTIDAFSGSYIPDLSELIAVQWGVLGIKVHLNVGLQEILLPKRINGDFEIHITSAPIDPLTQAHHFGAMGPNLPFWHRDADTDGPDWLVEVTEGIKQAQTIIDPEELRPQMEHLHHLVSTNIPFIALGALAGPWGANRRLGNVPDLLNPEDLYRAWDRSVYHEQIFIKAQPE